MLSLLYQALMNACIDTLSVYRTSVANQPQSSGLIAPHSLRLLPLFILAIMKHVSMTLFEQYNFCLCFLFSLAFPFSHVFQSCKPRIFPPPDSSRLSWPLLSFFVPILPNPSLFTGYITSVIMWIDHCKEIRKLTLWALALRHSDSFRRRANARNVSFRISNGGQFTLSSQLITPNYLVILPGATAPSFFKNLPSL